jgi:Ring finger domain
MLSSLRLVIPLPKRRRSGSQQVTFQIVEGDFPYEAPLTLPSALSFSGVLRENVEVESTTSTGATAPVDSIPSRNDLLEDDECAICHDSLSDQPAAMIQSCRHLYHDRCIRDWLSRQPRCPSCNGEVAMTTPGTSPSGTMTIQICPRSVCPGFAPDTTCIEIIYHIPAGIQHTVRTILNVVAFLCCSKPNYLSFFSHSFTKPQIHPTTKPQDMRTFHTTRRAADS